MDKKNHFDNRTLTQIQKKNHPFILKVGDYINNHTNDNRTNAKIKALYNTLKDKWMLNYGTSKFQPHHMKSVMFETCEAFMVSARNIIENSFSKTWIPPLRPPNIKTNTQACVSSIQTYSEVINHIAEDTFTNIQLLMTRTNYTMVILRSAG